MFNSQDKSNLMKLYRISYENRNLVGEIAKSFEIYTKSQIDKLFKDKLSEI